MSMAVAATAFLTRSLRTQSRRGRTYWLRFAFLAVIIALALFADFSRLFSGGGG